MMVKKSDPVYFIDSLGIFGFLTVLFMSLFFAFEAASFVTIVSLFGFRAYFFQGLRLVDFRLQILSTGAHLHGWQSVIDPPLTIILTTLFIFSIDFIIGLLRKFLKKQSYWMTRLIYLFGGLGLLLFVYLCYCHESSLFYWFALFPLIEGLMLMVLAAQ